MRTHAATTHDTYGRVPLCGAAMWDELVSDELAECWECRSIAGQPELEPAARATFPATEYRDDTDQGDRYRDRFTPHE